MATYDDVDTKFVEFDRGDGFAELVGIGFAELDGVALRETRV